MRVARKARLAGMNVNSASVTDTARSSYAQATGTADTANPVGKVWDTTVGGWVDDPDA